MANTKYNPCPLKFRDNFSKTTNQLKALLNCLSVNHLNIDEGGAQLPPETVGGCLWVMEDLVESLEKQADAYFDGGKTNVQTP